MYKIIIYGFGIFHYCYFITTTLYPVLTFYGIYGGMQNSFMTKVIFFGYDHVPENIEDDKFHMLYPFDCGSKKLYA